MNINKEKLDRWYKNNAVQDTEEIFNIKKDNDIKKVTSQQTKLEEEKSQQRSIQEKEVELLKKSLTVNASEFQETINSKTYFHGTMWDLSKWFDVIRSNTAQAIFLTENENFADSFWINREWLPWWRTYKIRVKCEKTFDFKNKQELQSLKTLITKLILQWYSYSSSGIKFVKYPTEFLNGIEHPTLEQITDYYMRRLEHGSRRMLESPPFIEYLKNQWYDSFFIDEKWQNNIAIFDASLISIEWYKQS